MSDDAFTFAPWNPEAAEETGYSHYSYWRSTFRTFIKNRLSLTLLIIMGVLVLFSLLYPVLASVDPNKVALDSSLWNRKPDFSHIFGTDGLGRDIWVRTWYGTRTSILLAFTIAFFDVGIGVVAGALWGYVRKSDQIMTEIYNVITNIPSTVYLILLSYIMKPGFWTIVIAMSSRGWITIARFIRNKVISLRESEYNVASRCLGTPLNRILGKNIIPFLVSIIIMQTALTIPYSIGAEVFLGFIGLGLPLDTVSLGNMVNQGRSNFMLYPFQLTWPTVILAVITVSFYIVGNKFADASDPKNHL
ncbi:ABC transporter permease subunit [Spirochaeta isovalerica]|uniref:Oligopeptide transport system permease protein n=1 Tax=Spirochaeta isovalerica TaxID=150 RepID=A0A841R9Q0_9SPIO|nr:oligopeptide transport system permease protein [Spirochaeta isovalerica]